MKVCLAGHLGSQRIVPASKYLLKKYLTNNYVDFDVTYLNYKGPIEGWAAYVAGFLTYLQDEQIVFALDDYLIADHIDMFQYSKAEEEFGDRGIGKILGCVKLCYSTDEENQEYPATTQYCIWDREYLISLLNRVRTPWELELQGSRIFDKEKTWIHHPCIKYFTNSSLSARWEGVNLEGLKEEDAEHIKNNLL